MNTAIIMDGNGRWAQARGLPRIAGHRAGAEALRPIVEAAPNLGIRCLTVYAFSSDNWRRPGPEVSALMQLLRAYLNSETSKCVADGVRLSIIGRRDRLSPSLCLAIAQAEAATASGRVLHFRIAVDYSSRDSIMRAAQGCAQTGEISSQRFAHALGAAVHEAAPAPNVDLLIRTGGEQRLSDFLLWECAYAELVFLKIMWPDFKPSDLEAAVNEFCRRERRFGGLPETITASCVAHTALKPRMSLAEKMSF